MFRHALNLLRLIRIRRPLAALVGVGLVLAMTPTVMAAGIDERSRPPGR